MFIQEHIYVCVLVYEQSDWYIRISRINYRGTYRVGHCTNFPFPSSSVEKTRGPSGYLCAHIPALLLVFDCFCSMYRYR